MDYKLALGLPKAKNESDKWGGHNKQIIHLNLRCFKKFCLKAGTSKANEIHEYFNKL